MNFPSINLNKSEQPYVVFGNANNGGYPSVMKHNNNIWEFVGYSEISNDYGKQFSISFDHNDVPHICYWGNDGKISVLFFNGTNWQFLGNPSFTPYDATFPVMAFDSSNTLYIAFRDFSKGGRASVMKFFENTWSYVGIAGFSAGNSTLASGAAEMSLKFSPENIPYLSFLDQINNWRLSVMRFNGESWEYVGPPSISENGVNSTSLAFDTAGKPVVAFVNHALNEKGSVLRFDGTAWSPIGTPACTPGKADLTSLQIDKKNKLYVTFKDFDANKRASVVYYDGNEWNYLGKKGFSDSTVWHITSVCNTNGEVYVAFKDESILTPKNSITVMKYNSHVVGLEKIETKAEKDLFIFPNPTSGILKVNNSCSIFQVRIYNIIGECVLFKNVSNNQLVEIDLRGLPKGLYTLESYSKSGVEIKKVILQ